MVAEPYEGMDGYAEWMAGLGSALPSSPPDAVTFRINGEPVARHDAHGHWERLFGKREKRRMLASLSEELTSKDRELKYLKGEVAGAHMNQAAVVAECERRLDEAATEQQQRARESTHAYRRVHGAQKEFEKKEAELAECRHRWREANGKLAAAETAAKAAARKLLSRERASAAAGAASLSAPAPIDTEGTELDDVRAQLQEVSEAYASLKEISVHLKEMADRNDELAKQSGEALTEFKEGMGVDPRYHSAPSTSFEGDSTRSRALPNWTHSVAKHVSAVLDGRLDTPDTARPVARAIANSGPEAIANLMQTPEFVKVEKDIAAKTARAIQDHWTARHTVHVWDRLELTDGKMETLRHLLSFVYDRTINKYVPIKIWVNPNDESDYVVMANVASRPARKKNFESIARTCNITIGDNGHCQRDVIEVTEMHHVLALLEGHAHQLQCESPRAARLLRRRHERRARPRAHARRDRQRPRS